VSRISLISGPFEGKLMHRYILSISLRCSLLPYILADNREPADLPQHRSDLGGWPCLCSLPGPRSVSLSLETPGSTTDSSRCLVAWCVNDTLSTGSLTYLLSWMVNIRSTIPKWPVRSVEPFLTFKRMTLSSRVPDHRKLGQPPFRSLGFSFQA